VNLYSVKICIVILLSLFILNGNAESLWTTDGDLIIVEGESDTKINIDDEGAVGYEINPSSSKPTFIYGTEALTVCMPTSAGIMCN
jgi:hypothetical protein